MVNDLNNLQVEYYYFNSFSDLV